MLKAENITFGYDKNNPILESVSFTVAKGEVVGLSAHSGRGKTTLGKILAGYENPHKGRVCLEGITPKKNRPNPVQMIFQHPDKAVNPKWKLHKILEESGVDYKPLLAPLGIDKSWLNRWPSELSGGELQRFCVLRALTTDTHFIIADEMTAMLDAVTQAEIWHFLLTYAKTHEIGLVVISHDQHLLKVLCHRVVTL